MSQPPVPLVADDPMVADKQPLPALPLRLPKFLQQPGASATFCVPVEEFGGLVKKTNPFLPQAPNSSKLAGVQLRPACGHCAA